jgi:hypothetical protein
MATLEQTLDLTSRGVTQPMSRKPVGCTSQYVASCHADNFHAASTFNTRTTNVNDRLLDTSGKALAVWKWPK